MTRPMTRRLLGARGRRGEREGRAKQEANGSCHEQADGGCELPADLEQRGRREHTKCTQGGYDETQKDRNRSPDHVVVRAA